MICKAVTILAIATACYAIPIEEALKPESPLQPVIVASPDSPKPELIAIPVEEKPLKPEQREPELVAVPAEAPLEQPDLIAMPVPSDAKIPGGKPEDDLKTDNTLWWSSYYKYPAYSKYYYKYHFAPRTYTYYESLPSTYTYWRSYW